MSASFILYISYTKHYDDVSITRKINIQNNNKKKVFQKLLRLRDIL